MILKGNPTVSSLSLTTSYKRISCTKPKNKLGLSGEEGMLASRGKCLHIDGGGNRGKICLLFWARNSANSIQLPSVKKASNKEVALLYFFAIPEHPIVLCKVCSTDQVSAPFLFSSFAHYLNDVFITYITTGNYIPRNFSQDGQLEDILGTAVPETLGGPQENLFETPRLRFQIAHC